jgi:hypothetical protein
VAADHHAEALEQLLTVEHLQRSVPPARLRGDSP